MAYLYHFCVSTVGASAGKMSNGTFEARWQISTAAEYTAAIDGLLAQLGAPPPLIVHSLTLLNPGVVQS